MPRSRTSRCIGVPDDKWGEAVHAVVVLHGERRCLRRRAARLVPRAHRRATSDRAAITFIADHEMPRTATGKILHRVLRERFAKPA